MKFRRESIFGYEQPSSYGPPIPQSDVTNLVIDLQNKVDDGGDGDVGRYLRWTESGQEWAQLPPGGGEMGPRGFVGPKGDQGDSITGDRGLRGLQGIRGPSGISNDFVQVNSDWEATSGPAEILNKPGLFSGAYADLSGKPTIPELVKSDWEATSGSAEILNKPELFSGAYADLSGKPTIPELVKSDWTSTSGPAEILNKPELFSGAYADLSGKPTIPAPQLNSDWNAISGPTMIINKPEFPTDLENTQLQTDWNEQEQGSVRFIRNKPVLFSGAYSDLSGKPSVPDEQVNADWNATSGKSEILNKPVLFSGAYSDLSGKPSVPDEQVNADWQATSGPAMILNKPDFPTDLENTQLQTDWNEQEQGSVRYIRNKPNLFSGAYADLTDKPSNLLGLYFHSTSTHSNNATIKIAHGSEIFANIFNCPSIPTTTQSGHVLTSIGTGWEWQAPDSSSAGNWYVDNLQLVGMNLRGRINKGNTQSYTNELALFPPVPTTNKFLYCNFQGNMSWQDPPNWFTQSFSWSDGVIKAFTAKSMENGEYVGDFSEGKRLLPENKKGVLMCDVVGNYTWSDNIARSYIEIEPENRALFNEKVYSVTAAYDIFLQMLGISQVKSSHHDGIDEIYRSDGTVARTFPTVYQCTYINSLEQGLRELVATTDTNLRTLIDSTGGNETVLSHLCGPVTQEYNIAYSTYAIDNTFRTSQITVLPNESISPTVSSRALIDLYSPDEVSETKEISSIRAFAKNASGAMKQWSSLNFYRDTWASGSETGYAILTAIKNNVSKIVCEFGNQVALYVHGDIVCEDITANNVTLGSSSDPAKSLSFSSNGSEYAEAIGRLEYHLVSARAALEEVNVGNPGYAAKTVKTLQGGVETDIVTFGKLNSLFATDTTFFGSVGCLGLNVIELPSSPIGLLQGTVWKDSNGFLRIGEVPVNWDGAPDFGGAQDGHTDNGENQA